MTVGPDGKVAVFTASGERVRCWPVDAREILAHGEASLTAPAPAPAKVETVRGSEATPAPRGTR